jgi:hypothetical protein
MAVRHAMSSRRCFLYKYCALALILLAASPVTAPFSTYQLKEHGQPTTGPAMGDVKAKGFSHPTFDSPVWLSLLAPMLSPVASSILAFDGEVVTRTILRPILRL